MKIAEIFRALSNERRLQILTWLKDPRAHFPLQVEGDLADDGVCGPFLAEKLGVTQSTLSQMHCGRRRVTIEISARRPHRMPQTTSLSRFHPASVSRSKRSSRTEPPRRAQTEELKSHDPAVAREAQTAFYGNRERLRNERLVREATEGPMLVPTPELPDDTPIERVLFSTRIQNALRAAELKTVGEVREISDETLINLPDFGKGSLSDLRKKLGLPSTDGVRPLGKKPA